VHVQSPSDDAQHTRLASAAPAQLVSKVRAATLAGERRIVTILFVDVVGSTKLTDQLDIETWTTIMNGAFDLVTPAIYQYEGTIARLLGDSLVAFFGAPVAHEDDPVRAVSAALDCLEPINDFARQVKEYHGIDFAMRFCLNTGPVIIGPVGDDLRYVYTSSSGEVNLAARLKFAAPPMTVIISENTFRFVEPLFDLDPLDNVEVKVRLEPVRAFQVLSRKTTPGTLRGLVGLESPMIGRDKELKDLLELCDYVQSGLGRAVLVTGEPGLGKSRLITEWQNAITITPRTPSPQWAEGHCLSYGQNMAYHLVLDLLRSLLGVPEGASEDEINKSFQALIIDLFGDLESQSALDVYAHLGHLLSIELDGEALERVRLLDPQAMQTRYSTAMSALLTSLASNRPLILVFEDLHWADPSSTELISRLLPLVFNTPILFCLVSRPDLDSPGWKLITSAREILGGSLTEVSLNTLSDTDSRDLVANLLEIEALPGNIRELILQKSEGNPFFVEEVVRMLIDQRAITRQGDKWLAEKDIENITIPDNLQGLLMARIDRLSEESKWTLRVASVVGRQFPVKVLQQVLTDDQPVAASAMDKTMRSLSNLESAGLIRLVQIEPDIEYLFRHTLVQDAAYDSLLFADRKKLHLMVGETVEQIYPDRLDSRELAPRLGQHFSAAGDDNRALKYFTLAGNAALDSYSNPEAEKHFLHALNLPTTEDERAQLLESLGESLARQSRYEEANQIWFEAIDSNRKTGNHAGVARLFAKSSRAAWWQGDTPRGLQICLDGYEVVKNAPESHEIALLVHETARAYHFNGVPDKASDWCQRALEMAERLNDVEVQADALATFGILSNQPPDVAIDALTRAVELVESENLFNIANRANLNLGTIRQSIYGDTILAVKDYERALDASRHRGVPQEIFFTFIGLIGINYELTGLDVLEKDLQELEDLAAEIADPDLTKTSLLSSKAYLLALRGEFADSLLLFHECRATAQQRGDLQHLLNYDANIAFVNLEKYLLGEEPNWEEVEELLAEAIDLAGRGLSSKVWPMSLLSLSHTLQGNYEEAHRLLEAAYQEKTDQSPFWNFMNLSRAEGYLAAAEGRWEESLEAFEKITEKSSEKGHRWSNARHLCDWGDALVARGEPTDVESARQLYDQALAIYGDLGATWLAKQVEKRLHRVTEMIRAQAVEQGEVALEMAQARRVQASFLPEKLPQMPGYDLAVRLEPARETSGDFYDFISLPGDQQAIIVADVADKGAAAALFMTSCRTLLRTYALEFPNEPERIVASVNNRLLKDTHSGLFVTLFYGVLDPKSNELVYVNAGHNPPLLLERDEDLHISALEKSGMPIGILEDQSWESGRFTFKPDDILIVYTDGFTEAQNENGEYYGENRLKKLLRDTLQVPPQKIIPSEIVLKSLYSDLNHFLGQSPRSDDTTLLVLVHQKKYKSL
jgi:serine phosphatase RsbU (regulator of sigma subunit)/class 3 adenylate cyclase